MYTLDKPALMITSTFGWREFGDKSLAAANLGGGDGAVCASMGWLEKQQQQQQRPGLITIDSLSSDACVCVDSPRGCLLHTKSE